MAQILVIDDDISVAQLVADVVSFCKHMPIVVSDPLEAVLLLGRTKFGAILTDYMMPRLDGIELLMIAQEAHPSVRRVLITAAPNEEQVKQNLHSGVVQLVIPKPPGIAEIRMALAWL